MRVYLSSHTLGITNYINLIKKRMNKQIMTKFSKKDRKRNMLTLHESFQPNNNSSVLLVLFTDAK